MSLHYIAIEEFKDSPIFWTRQRSYVDYIIINDAQLAFLKYFFEHYVTNQGEPAFMKSNFYYSFHEVQENENVPEDEFFGLYVNDSRFKSDKLLTAIHTSEWGIETYFLLYDQITMMIFLTDFITDADNFFTYSVIDYEIPMEIS